MRLEQFMRRTTFGAERPRAPKALLYIPPQGAPVQCQTVEAAMDAAETYAGEHPGTTVAVYELVGYAHKPIEKPAFVAAGSDEDQHIDGAPPDDAEYTAEDVDYLANGGAEPDHSHLSPEQQSTMDRLKAATRGEE